jgi:hypothetical protein
MSKKIRGSCLCGGVRFEVEPPFIRAGHCHCEDFIRVYGKGEGAVKAFCVNCGSSLFGGDWPEGDEVSIRMGTFDDNPGIRPQFHTFVDDRAAWDEIADDLPQYPGTLPVVRSMPR